MNGLELELIFAIVGIIVGVLLGYSLWGDKR